MRHALDLFSWQGRVSRRAYLLAGLLLFAIKYPLDLAISQLFHKPWNPLMYLSPRVSPLLHSDSPAYWIALLIIALPFIVAGVSLSARRLRDMGVHPFWSGLFFLPFAHFAFFLALAVAPPQKSQPAPPLSEGPYREGAGPPPPVPAPPRFLTRAIPRSEGGAFLFALLLGLTFGLISYVITVQVSQTFGSALFIGVPFGLGFLEGFCMSVHRQGTMLRSIGYSIIPAGIALLLLMSLGWEGMACAVMAFPIIGGISALGGIIGHLCARNAKINNVSAALCLLAIPGYLGHDVAEPPAPASFSVVSRITIAAPPEVVWNNVISFPPIDEPPSPIFAIVAMPISARIEGKDPGALRRCIFTNGEFEEPIEVWNAPRELTFGVRAQPHPIDGYLDVRRGQFLLTDNHDGTTTLTGTTWYELRVHPVTYWRAWSDLFLHSIHMRVMEHVKRLSEHPSEAHAGAAAIPSWMATSHATCRCTSHPSITVY